MPFSVMTGSRAFQLKPKLISIATLISIYWFYDFNATSFHNFLIIFGYFFSLYLFILKSFNLIIVLMVIICLKKRSMDHRENFSEKNL